MSELMRVSNVFSSSVHRVDEPLTDEAEVGGDRVSDHRQSANAEGFLHQDSVSTRHGF
jgi:hypothetical protein